jgi:hypothetical protein
VDSGDAELVAPVIDPGLTAEAQRRLIRGGGSTMGAAGVACLGLVAVGVIWVMVSAAFVLSGRQDNWWVGGSLFLTIAASVAFFAVTGSQTPDLDYDRLIEPSSLDESGRELLLRAQRAIGTVLGSDVYAADLLDQAAGKTVLKRHEWEIATALRDITTLRAELASSAADGAPGPMTAAVLDSHRRALTLAQNATTSRVSALERYATQVKAADAAQRDYRSAQKAAGLNEKYLDLVARTAADEHALAEITDMTERAAAAEQVFRDSLHQATLAAAALAFPPAG